MARAQGSYTNAKADTAYFGDSPTITTDVSQEFTDLTVTAGGGYELASARASLPEERTVFIRWEADGPEAFAGLIVHGHQGLVPADSTWSIATSGTGEMCGKQNGIVIWTTASPVAAKEYLISWSVRDNPDTDGPSNTKISEFIMWNETDGTLFDMGQTTHATSTTDVAWDLSVGGWWNGASLQFSPVNPPTVVRISRAHHPNVEVFEDWVAARTAYAGTAADGIVEPVGPRPIDSGLGDAGEFTGRSVWGYGAARDKAVRLRSWSHVVNEVLTDAQETGSEPPQWIINAPGSQSFSMSIQHLRWVPVPPEATHVHVRVHVSTTGAGLRTIRVYAMNKPPGLAQINGDPAPNLAYFFVGTFWAPGIGSDVRWLDLGYLRIPRFTAVVPGWTDTIHLCIAKGSGARTVDAWSARPVQRFIPGGLDP